MTELISFLVVVAAGVFLPALFKRFHMPYIVALILAGIIIGPHVLNFYSPGPTVEFLSEIGLVFLMFIAGLETSFPDFRKGATAPLTIAVLNGVIPFFIGMTIMMLLGYGLIASVLVGIIFLSSSIAIIVPFFDSTNLLRTKLGSTILSATVMEDTLSLILLSMLLQFVNPTSTIPLPLLYVFLFAFIIFLGKFIKWVEKRYLSSRSKYVFEERLRLNFALMLVIVVIFDLLGLHSIIAGFFAGLTLSEFMRDENSKEKLRAVSYGVFIPIFFIVVGTQTDIPMLLNGGSTWALVLFIVVGAIASKFLSGYIGGRMSGFNSKESGIIASSSIPQLSTTLAVAFTGLSLGILDERVVVAITILSIVSTIVGPMILHHQIKEREEK